MEPEIAEKRGIPVPAWREALAGWRVLISFQTKAEVLVGIHGSNWGERRIATARDKLDSALMVGLDREIIEAFAKLTLECRRAGHGLQGKIHAADRWIAACAIAKHVPLLARDGIYANAPGLQLFGYSERQPN